MRSINFRVLLNGFVKFGFLSSILFLSIQVFGQEPIQKSNNTADQMLRSSGRVNPSSLGMEFDLPLGSYPGRGISLPLGLSYSSKQWRLEEFKTVQGSNGTNQTWVNPLYSYDAAAGWTSSLSQPYIEYTGHKYRFLAGGRPQSLDEVIPPGGTAPSGNLFIKRITVFLPSGSVELRAQDAPIALNPDEAPAYTDWNGTFYSTDGSGMKYVQDSTATPTPIYRLYMPDGSYYDFNTDWENKTTTDIMKVRYANKLSDVHGNYVQYHEPADEEEEEDYPYGYWTDQLGRTFPVMIPRRTPAMPSGESVLTQSFTMPGMTQPYTFKWKKLKNTTAATSAFTDFTNYDLHYLGPFAGASTSMPYSPALFGYEPEYKCSGSSQLVRAFSPTSDMFNPVVLTDIILPTGAAYTFSYSEYGEVERINYPTGGREEIDYAEVPSLSELTGLYKKANRGVVERRVYENDSDPTADTWEFSAARSDNNYRTSVVAPDGTQTDRFMHRGAPPLSCGQQSASVYYGTQWGYDNILAGMVYDERVFSSGTPKHILRRTLTKWTSTSSSVVMTNPSTYMQRNARVYSTESITYDGDAGLSAATRLVYDTDVDDFGSPQNSIRTQEYAFSVVSGGNSLTAGEAPPTAAVTVSDPTTSATLVRISETDYLNTSTDPVLTTTKTEAANKNVLRLPIGSRIKTPSGAIVSQSITAYDTAGKGLPLTVYSWDSTKGAVTSSGSYISASATYDSFGNKITSTDAKGFTTTTEYDDTYYAYPVKIESPVPDSSGSQGSNTALITQISYDLVTGLPLTTTDANDQVTSMTYDTDTLRIVSVQAPNGHLTEYQYGTPNSEGRFISDERYTRERVQIDETKWNDSYSRFDGLGRKVRAQKVNSHGDIYIDTEYEPMGKVKTFTNPYRPGESVIKTENFYDDLGRTVKIKTPDAAEVKTTYGIAASGSHIGITSVVEDQAGKTKRTITNAQGQLTRVDEPTDTGGLGTVSTPNQPTYYSYNLQDKLTQVVQGAQERVLTYSSRSLLVSATTPESGLMTYAYDNNANLITRTDARGVVTNYSYDGLNRLRTRSYSNETGYSTPEVNYFYDNLTHAKGKEIKVSSSVSTTEYLSFDIMGRPTAHKQSTNGAEYSTAYTYNLLGEIIEETYPSTRKVKNILGQNGELSAVESKKNSNFGYWTYADSLTYTAAGAVSSMQLGNGRWESTSFNSRLQPTRIALGTTPGAMDLLQLDYSYGTTQNNGNILSQTITTPANGTYSGFTAVQTYSYDSLNRLKDAAETISGSQTWKQSFNLDRYGNRRFEESNTTTLTKSCGSAPNFTVCAGDRKIENPELLAGNNRVKGDQDGDQVADYIFDSAGNTTKQANGVSYVYDAENMQVEAKSANNTTIGRYWYDGDGKRVKKQVPATGETTIFVYDASGRMIAEYSTEVTVSPRVSYLTNDNLQSTRISTDRQGSVVSRNDYHPFGEEIATSHRTEELGYTQDDGLRKQFTGYERDDETGLDYAQARYFNAMHGRFSTPDDLTNDASTFDPQKWNLYSYVRNNPIRYNDPSGKELWVIVNGSPYRAQWCGEKIRLVDVADPKAPKFATEESAKVAETLLNNGPQDQVGILINSKGSDSLTIGTVKVGDESSERVHSSKAGIISEGYGVREYVRTGTNTLTPIEEVDAEKLKEVSPEDIVSQPISAISSVNATVGISGLNERSQAVINDVLTQAGEMSGKEYLNEQVLGQMIPVIPGFGLSDSEHCPSPTSFPAVQEAPKPFSREEMVNPKTKKDIEFKKKKKG